MLRTIAPKANALYWSPGTRPTANRPPAGILRTGNTLKIRFFATLGHEPKVELALI
jgi:hypothetical protein